MNINKTPRGERPVFPKRAVVTAGMPYGNKLLYFHHIGGVFTHADTYARFLRDRIGKENVLFVSGTDCYGSPIVVSLKKLREEGYTGTVEDFVMGNHIKQKQALEKYEMSLDLFGASAFGDSGRMHDEVSEWLFNKLYENGWLEKLSTAQFYDDEHDTFLNGRQVVGRCPFEGCGSEKAYADECELGHQYMPSELIDPVSTLSGKRPSIRNVENWYFALEDCCDFLKERNEYQEANSVARKFQLNTIGEFLKPPCIYVQRKQIEDMGMLCSRLPEHELVDEEKKPSVTFVFRNLDDRDKARQVLDELSIRYRTGKTLVPFRLSGNVEWGVPVPEKEGVSGLTFWVWPESLWAPISFTRTVLKARGCADDEWLRWWNSDDAAVYQFIGQDNIYFYAIAEMGIAAALTHKKGEQVDISKVNFPHIIANNHILFMDKKASSSAELKPPLADELLEFYTPEQLRMHFLSLGLAARSTSFKPQAYMAEEEKQGADNVLKEGNLLTNVYNRILRSCFYSLQTWFDGNIPTNEVSQEVLELSREAVLEYERHMYNHDFHRIMSVLDSYIRQINKIWAANSKSEDDAVRRQTLTDCLHGVRVAAVLLHPIAPVGCEMVREYLNVDERLWSWDYIFEPLSFFFEDKENHRFKFLEPKTDFFTKLECQFGK